MTEPATDAAARLLDIAGELLTGERPIGGINRSRAACWAARRALELRLVSWLAAKQIEVGTATTRSRLICLVFAYDQDPEFVVAVQQQRGMGRDVDHAG